MVDSVFEYFALFTTILCVLLSWLWFRLIPAKPILFLTLGYAYWFVLKICLVERVTFVTVHSRSLSAGIGTLMVVGLYLFLRYLYRMSAHNGDKARALAAEIERKRVDAMVKAAVELAADTRRATAETADAALEAKERALEAEALAREVENHIGK
jgi:hypothetical protein